MIECMAGAVLQTVPQSLSRSAPALPEVKSTPQTGLDGDGWAIPHLVTLEDGSRVQLYKDGQALLAAYDAIKNACARICLEVYIFHSDATGNAFADLLCDKARQGVRVNIIYDSFGSMDADPRLFARLREAGARVGEFHPIRPWDSRYGWRPANRDHRKLLVIDDQIAGMGGLNLGAEYGGSSIIKSAGGKSWRDSAVGIVGPAARHLRTAFAHTWNYVTHGGRIRKAELIHDINGHCGPFGLLASVPTLSSPLRPLLQHLLRSATRSIDLTMAYFAPDDPLIDGLCRAAQRGVRVRLMLPGQTDVRFLQIAARSFYQTLMSAGVLIYERQGVILHAKTMCIDDQLTVIGSTNLDYRSIEYNCELSALIRSGEFGRQLRQLFENDIHHAVQISLADWRHRPLYDRFVQWAVSRARYLL